MIVYLDLIFLTNFLIDGVLLAVTARTRKIQIIWWRLLLAAALGAAYVVFMFFPSMSFMFTFMVKMCFAFFMILICFGFINLRHFLRNFGTFYLINFVAAGGILGIHYLWETSSEVLNGVSITQSGGLTHEIQLGAAFVAITFLLLMWFYRVVFLSSKQREELTSYLAKVHIYIGPAQISCTGLIDTGNQLYDPLTRTPVMVLEASECEAYIPDVWMKRIRESDADQIIAAMGAEGEEEPFDWQDRLRLVPYRGINKGTRFMLAIKPDRIVIHYNEKEIESHKVFIGLDGGKLSSDNSYQAILHPVLLQL
jgi:stage II sporulation protein GA (sporulation sigma-E factor processing peptidase)